MTKIRTIKVGQDALTGGKNPHYALVAGRKVEENIVKCETLVNNNNRMENLIGMILWII